MGDYTALLARALAARSDVRVAILTARHGNADQPRPADGVDVLEPITRWSVRQLHRALAAVRAWMPDVLHIQYPGRGYDGPLVFLMGTAARWLHGIPLVLTLHEAVPLDLQVPTVAALYGSASELIVVRPNLRGLMHPMLRWMLAGRRLRFMPTAPTLPRATRSPERVRAVRERFRAGGRALVAYFGYLHPSRGVHQLFRIADPSAHCLVIVGGRFRDAAGYFDEVTARAGETDWRGACVVTGFLPEADAAEILACADAVVLPYERGTETGNSSVKASRHQGTFVLTTSRSVRGYVPRENVYYAAPGDVAEMRQALVAHLGTRCEPADIPTWEEVVAEHLRVYAGLCPSRST